MILDTKIYRISTIDDFDCNFYSYLLCTIQQELSNSYFITTYSKIGHSM